VKIVDLSRELYHRTPSYPGHPPVMHGMWKTHEEALAESRNVYGLSSMFISMPDHAGTHIDAPRHFGRSGISIDQYPLEKCIVPGICLDLRHIPPRAEIKPSDLKMAVEKAGAPVPKGGTVLLCTGHHERTFPRKEYSTDNPGVNVAATEWLAKQGIVHFGIDSMRPGPDSDKPAGSQGLSRPRHHPHREPVQSRGAARPGPLHLHRPANEVARRDGFANPRRGRI
jgi:kynurenine formamidase